MLEILWKNVFWVFTSLIIDQLKPKVMLRRKFSAKLILIFIISLHIYVINSQNPALTWAKQIGGTGLDVGKSIAVDGWGNTYVAGYFEGIIDVNPGPQCNFLSSEGGKDIFLVKLDNAGNYCWGFNIGGSYDDYAYSVDVSTMGQLFITGSFQGNVDFNPGASCSFLSSQGGHDIFVMSVNANGSFCWAKQIGGCSTDVARSVKADSWGNVYFCGSFCGNVDFNPGYGNYTLCSAGYNDAFIEKLDFNGNFCWAKKIGSFWDDNAYSLAIDNSGNIVFTGNYAGSFSVDTYCGPALLQEYGGYDIFAIKINGNGSILWVRSVGGNIDDTGQSVSTDQQGNIYLTGIFSGVADFDPSMNTTILCSSGSFDIFALKLDFNGNYCWAKKIGGTGFDSGNCIVNDNQNNILLTGFFEGNVDFDPDPAVCYLNSCGSQDIFLLKLDNNGNFKAADKFGSFNQDIGNCVDADNNGNYYLTGFFKNNVDFDPGPGNYILTSFGNADAFALKFGQCSPCLPVNIACHPQSQLVTEGSQAVFSVSVSGTPPFAYQWKKNGCTIPGANGNTYITPPVNNGDNGSIYSCTVSNCGGICVNSQGALLTVYSSCFYPTIQASCITFSNVTGNQISLNWLIGNGTKRIVVAKANCEISGIPVNGVCYYANSAFGLGGFLAPGEFVVYNGSGSGTTVTNLQPNTTYHFRIFEYCCNIPNYQTCSAFGNPASKKTSITCPPPHIQANYITFSEIGVQEMTVHWNNGNGAKRLVVAKEWSDVQGLPVNGFNYSASNIFGEGSMLGPGEFVVYNGTGNYVYVKNLSSSTRYYFRIFEYCCDPPQYLCCSAYGNSNWQETGSYCFGPTVQSSNISFTQVWPEQVSLSWIKGNGEKRIVVAKCNKEIKGIPLNGKTYYANNSFGSGSQVEPGEFVIYNGNGNSINLTNLEPGKKYYFRVFEYNCFKEQYLLTDAEDNPVSITTPVNCSPPTIQAYDITFSDPKKDRLTINWKNGNGTERILVCKIGSQVTKTPVNGTIYEASSIFKNGDFIGAGEYVVYNGTGNSVTLTNLSEGKTYFFRLFEYTCYPPYYIGSAASDNPNGYTLGATIPTIKAFIADNVIKNEPALAETYNFYRTTNPYTQNNPLKICADGSSATTFRIKASSVTGLNIQVKDEFGQIVVDGKNSIDFARYGVFSYPPEIKGDTLNITYTHPQYMDLTGKQSRQLYLRISFNGVAISGISIPLNIFRAPVLLIPGIWSSETDFNQLRSFLISSKNYYTELLASVYYNESSAAEFEENDLAVSEGIMTLFSKLRTLKYSMGKVDLIAQGTGGILARRYLQETGSLTYKNDINKLLTINTPHIGSQIGNLLTHNIANPAKTVLNLLGFNVNSGAIGNIKVNSTEVAMLNSTAINHNSVPLFSLYSELDYKNLNNQSNEWSKFILNMVYNSNKPAFNKFDISSPESLANYIYFGEQGDGFVPVSSQKGGIQLTNENAFNSSHYGVYSNTDIFNTLISKLNENPYDPAKFWKNGYPALPQLPYRNFILEPDDNSLIGIENDSVKIFSPVNNAVYFSGDSIFVSCRATQGITDMFAVAGGDKRIFEIIQTTSDSIGQWIHIPADFAGKAVIYCSGSDEESFVDDDTVFVNVIPKAAIDSIEISPEFILVGTGNYKNFNVYGYFHDNIKRKINDLPGVLNKISPDSLAQIVSNVKILGKKSGVTKLVSTYQDKKDSIAITVYFAVPQKRADFEANNNIVCQGAILRFENTSTGNPDSVKWIFESGKPVSSDADVQFVEYDSSGFFDVTLIAYFENESDTMYIDNYINVIAAPQINVQIDGSVNFCEGETVTLIASEATIYNWSNGEKTQSIQVKRSGDYLVTITDDTGCSAVSDTIPIHFNPILNPQVTVNSDKTAICQGELVKLSAVPVNGGDDPEFKWFVNGIEFKVDSSIIIIDSLYENAQIYCTMNSNAKCLNYYTAVSNFVSIAVEKLKTPEITISTDKLIYCKGETVKISTETLNGGSDPVYSWFIDGKPEHVSNSYIESDSFNNNSQIYCTLRSNEKCLTDTVVISDTIKLNINEILTPTISISSSDTLVCGGKDIKFVSNTVAGGVDPKFQWFVNGIIQASDTSEIIIKNVTKDLQVFCIMTSDEKCISSPTAVSNFVNIVSLPVLVPAITITGTSTSVTACDDIEFTAAPVNGGHNPEIDWYVDGIKVSDGLKFSTNALLNGSQVYCKMKSSDPCSETAVVTSNIITMAVNPMVQPVIKLSNDSIISVNYKNSNYTFKWFFNGNNISSKSFLKCSEFGSGFYYLVIENNHCSVTSNTVYINCTTGNTEIQFYSTFDLFPNPATDEVNLINNSGSDGVFFIRDVHGKLIARIESNIDSSEKYNTAALSDGIYIVEFNNDNGSIKQFKKLMIVK